MTRRRWIADTWTETTAALKGEQAAHLARVLRAQVGQIFDVVANGFLHRAEVMRASERDIRAQRAERLGDERLRLDVRHEPGRVVLRGVLDAWNRAQERQVETVADLVRSLHGVVESVLQGGARDSERYTDHGSEEDGPLPVWRYRNRREHRGVDHPNAPGLGGFADTRQLILR